MASVHPYETITQGTRWSVRWRNTDGREGQRRGFTTPEDARAYAETVKHLERRHQLTADAALAYLDRLLDNLKQPPPAVEGRVLSARRQGGLARAAALTPQQRVDIARKAANVRWRTQ